MSDQLMTLRHRRQQLLEALAMLEEREASAFDLSSGNLSPKERIRAELDTINMQLEQQQEQRSDSLDRD